MLKIAYDPATKQVILFGGLSLLPNGKMLNDTWAWDGNDWIQQYLAASPPARALASLAFDPAWRIVCRPKSPDDR